jgi:pilus assembly protein CpaB
MVTLNSVRTEVEPVTQVVLQNVMVLGNNQSIGRNSGGQATDIGVVTLLVTPEEAEKLAMAESNGRLHLALRNYLDADTVDTPGIRTSGLLRRAALPPAPSGGARAPAPPPVRRIIEVIRGQQRSEVRPGGGG